MARKRRSTPTVDATMVAKARVIVYIVGALVATCLDLYSLATDDPVGVVGLALMLAWTFRLAAKRALGWLSYAALLDTLAFAGLAGKSASPERNVVIGTVSVAFLGVCMLSALAAVSGWGLSDAAKRGAAAIVVLFGSEAVLVWVAGAIAQQRPPSAAEVYTSLLGQGTWSDLVGAVLVGGPLLLTWSLVGADRRRDPTSTSRHTQDLPDEVVTWTARVAATLFIVFALLLPEKRVVGPRGHQMAIGGVLGKGALTPALVALILGSAVLPPILKFFMRCWWRFVQLKDAEPPLRRSDRARVYFACAPGLSHFCKAVRESAQFLSDHGPAPDEFGTGWWTG